MNPWKRRFLETINFRCYVGFRTGIFSTVGGRKLWKFSLMRKRWSIFPSGMNQHVVGDPRFVVFFFAAYQNDESNPTRNQHHYCKNHQ